MSLNEKSRKLFLERKKDKNKIGNYIMGATIEDNIFIKIRKGKNLTTNENVIIKIIDKSYLYENENNLNNLAAEISILKILHHKNLIRLYELREMATYLYIIMEYCDNNSLFEYVKNYYYNKDKNKDHNINLDNNINTYDKKDNFNSINETTNEKSRNRKTESNLLINENSNSKSESSEKIKLHSSKKNLINLTNSINNFNNNNNNANYNSEKNTNLNLSATSANTSLINQNQNLKTSQTNNLNLPETEACRLFQDLIDGLEYLHSQNICIRDFNPHNLFLDYKLNLKISNFSFSKIYANDKLLKTPIGMLQFTAPEVLLGKGYHGLFSDIWSAGITLYFMLTGTFPFHDESDEVSLKKINENKLDFSSGVSPLAQDLILNILNKNCLERFDLTQIKSHAWFNLVKPNLNQGLNINFVSIPVDEKIVFKLENLEFDGETLRSKIKDNIHDESTAVYYLFLKNQIKGGYKSIADLESQLFLDYISNPRNFIKNIELIKKEKELLNEESEYLKNNYDYCGNVNENNFRKFSNERNEQESFIIAERKESLLVEERLKMSSEHKKLKLDTSSRLSKNTLLKSLTSKTEKHNEFQKPSNLNSCIDFDFNKENQEKDKNDIDYQKGLLYNIEEIGNDFDQPDEDLINLMNSSKEKKEKKTPDKIRKSSIVNKYSAEPIKEESVIDYVKPKKNSYLLFLERNDVFGKLSYNKKERESLFKPIGLDNHYDLTDSKDSKTLIEKFRNTKNRAKISPEENIIEKADFISKANKRMLFNFFRIKIQEIINEDEEQETKLDEKKTEPKLNKNLKNKSPKRDKHKEPNSKHNNKNLRQEIKAKEKELLSNKQILLKSSNIRERIREYSKETSKKRSTLNKLNNREVETIVENLYNFSSEEDSNSNSSASEEKQKQEFKVFKPRKIEKKQDPKEKQKELKNKAKEFSKNVKINEEQKQKNKSDKREFALCNNTANKFENNFVADKYDLKKINNYFRSDKNKDFVKLLEKYFNMENGPINMEIIEKILKDLYEQKPKTICTNFYKEIKDINKKIKVIIEDKNCTNFNLNFNKSNGEANNDRSNYKPIIKAKPIRTSSLPKNLNSACNYDYLLKDLTAKIPLTHKSLIFKEKNHLKNKDSNVYGFFKTKKNETSNYYQKTSFSAERIVDQEEEAEDIGVFIDENFIGKLKENIKKTLKETDHILVESGKIKKDIIKSNQNSSNLKNKILYTSVPNCEIKNLNNKKFEIKNQKFSSLEKINLDKAFKYMILKTETNNQNKSKRGLSIDFINHKSLDASTIIKSIKGNDKEEIKFKKFLEEENISPVNNLRNQTRFNNFITDNDRNNCIKSESKNQINKNVKADQKATISNFKPIIKIIKVKDEKNVKDLNIEADAVKVNIGNEYYLNDFEQKQKSNIFENTFIESVSPLNLIKEEIKTQASKNTKELFLPNVNDVEITKKDSNSKNTEKNNSDMNSNILNTDSNEILNYKNLLENLGVYGNTNKNNNKKNYQSIVNNTNISITIKKKNYYFDNKADVKGKSILKKIEVLKDDKPNQNHINNQGKLSESTLDSFNYREILNLNSNKDNSQKEKNNFDFYTTFINNKKKENNNLNLTKEKAIFLTEMSNAESSKTVNKLVKTDTINLTESEDSSYLFSKDFKSNKNEFFTESEKQNNLEKLINNSQQLINQSDFKKIFLNKNTTANLICQNKTEEKNKINLNSTIEDSIKKHKYSAKNDFIFNEKANAKIIKVDKQNIHTIIMNYLAESKTSFYFNKEKFKITKNTFNYEIELTKMISVQNESKALNSLTNSYFVKFVYVQGNKINYNEEISKIQNLFME